MGPIDGPTGGEISGRIAWTKPPLFVSQVATSPKMAAEAANVLEVAVRSLRAAVELGERLERLVPRGFRVANTRVRYEPTAILVEVEFEVNDAPEQLAVTERDEVVVDHPAGEVVVPIERARVEPRDVADLTWTPLGAVSSHVCPSCGQAWIYTAEPGETITLGPDTCTNPWHGRLVDDPKRTPLGSLRTW